MIENCAKNEDVTFIEKSLTPYAAYNKNYFIFFIFFAQVVAHLIEKYAENEGEKKCRMRDNAPFLCSINYFTAKFAEAAEVDVK